MPSFDVVSEVNLHELTNAVDQANRELANRFDFKGTGAHIERGDELLTLQAQNAFQLKQMLDILYGKLAKRAVDVASLDAGKIEERANRARQELRIRHGIDRDTARRIVKLIKDTKLKLQAAVQGEQVRVSGKHRDELQRAIVMLREAKLEIPLQFVNFRD